MADKRKEILAELSEDELKEMIDANVTGAGTKEISVAVSKSLCPTTACTRYCGK